MSRSFLFNRQRKQRSDAWFTVPGKHTQIRFVPIELAEWLGKIGEDREMPIGAVCWAILRGERKRKVRYKLSDVWEKYKYNGHRRISIYVDVPLGEWLNELCGTQHRSLNYAVVSLLKAAHNRYLESGEMPGLDLFEIGEDAQ